MKAWTFLDVVNIFSATIPGCTSCVQTLPRLKAKLPLTTEWLRKIYSVRWIYLRPWWGAATEAKRFLPETYKSCLSHEHTSRDLFSFLWNQWRDVDNFKLEWTAMLLLEAADLSYQNSKKVEFSLKHYSLERSRLSRLYHSVFVTSCIKTTI